MSTKRTSPTLTPLNLTQMSSSSYNGSFSYHLYQQNDQNTPLPPQTPVSIPIQSPSTPALTPIPIHHPTSTLTSAATKIQSRYRSHLIRTLFLKILSISSQTDRFQRLIQRQETVDSIRNSERERIKLNEDLMALLLTLDSVPGYFDPNVRELRRRASRRIVELQGILDGVVGERVDDAGFESLPRSWGELLEKIWAKEENERVEVRRGGGCCCCKGMRCLEELVREM